jgi:hypothetical protein
MSNAPRILYHSRADTSSKEELDALAAVYATLLKTCLLKKKAAEPNGCDDEKLVHEERRLAWLDECREPKGVKDKTRPVRRS